MKVYIAGPYTSDPGANVGDALRMWHTLKDIGYHPYCPHLTHFLEIAKKRPYEDWIEEDLVWLRVCDVLLRLPGESSGADGEVDEANKVGIPVFYSYENMVLNCPPKS